MSNGSYALENVSFTIKEEIAAILGKSGAGNSARRPKVLRSPGGGYRKRAWRKDSVTAKEIMRLLAGFNRQGDIIIIVTRAPPAVQCVRRIIILGDGRIHRDETPHQKTSGRRAGTKYMTEFSL